MAIANITFDDLWPKKGSWKALDHLSRPHHVKQTLTTPLSHPKAPSATGHSGTGKASGAMQQHVNPSWQEVSYCDRCAAAGQWERLCGASQ